MKFSNKKVLITGAAGFIGFHLSKKLVALGFTVTGLDNLNDYYSVQLKEDRIAILSKFTNFHFVKADLCNKELLIETFKREKFDYVVNLAAQPGVRYSLENPDAYISSNIIGFQNLLEACRKLPVKHLVFASSSSVYGANTKMPFSVKDNVDHPISLYAATKKANELMAHTYSHLFKIPSTGLRFFTVYGPWGRPDMALFMFTKAIIEHKPIDVYNYGKMKRDFTYVDDIVEAIVALLAKPPQPNLEWDSKSPDPSTSFAPYKLYNIGNNQPEELITFINSLEEALGKKAKMNLLPLQDGDVLATYANIDGLIEDIRFKPKTSLKEGVTNFVNWYKNYYKTSQVSLNS